MSSDYYGPGDLGSSPFDEFLARIYGGSAAGRPVQRVDITRLMSGPARELLGSAAAYVAEHGGTDLDTEHLLWAAARLEPTRDLLARAGADPDALAAEIEHVMAGSERRGEPPQLTPGPSGRCWTRTRSPAPSAPPTSGRSTSCSLWR